MATLVICLVVAAEAQDLESNSVAEELNHVSASHDKGWIFGAKKPKGACCTIGKAECSTGLGCYTCNNGPAQCQEGSGACLSGDCT